jgi:hypothetical protein
MAQRLAVQPRSCLVRTRFAALLRGASCVAQGLTASHPPLAFSLPPRGRSTWTRPSASGGRSRATRATRSWSETWPCEGPSPLPHHSSTARQPAPGQGLRGRVSACHPPLMFNLPAILQGGAGVCAAARGGAASAAAGARPGAGPAGPAPAAARGAGGQRRRCERGPPSIRHARFADGVGAAAPGHSHTFGCLQRRRRAGGRRVLQAVERRQRGAGRRRRALASGLDSRLCRHNSAEHEHAAVAPGVTSGG